MRLVLPLLVFLLIHAPFLVGCGGSSQGGVETPPTVTPPPTQPPEEPPPDVPEPPPPEEPPPEAPEPPPPEEPPPETPPPGESPPQGGLDERPTNLSCLAPDRPTSDPGVQLERVYPALSFQQPLGMLQAPNDASRWFVLEKTGRVRVFDNQSSVTVTSNFLDLSAVVNTASEGGLLGMAFDPDFASTGTAYVSYTRTPVGGGGMESVISRFSSLDGGLSLSPTSEQILLVIAQPFNRHRAVYFIHLYLVGFFLANQAD